MEGSQVRTAMEPVEQRQSTASLTERVFHDHPLTLQFDLMTAPVINFHTRHSRQHNITLQKCHSPLYLSINPILTSPERCKLRNDDMVDDIRGSWDVKGVHDAHGNQVRIFYVLTYFQVKCFFQNRFFLYKNSYLKTYHIVVCCNRCLDSLRCDDNKILRRLSLEN